MGHRSPHPVSTLTHDERDALERWARWATTARTLAERARLLLACTAACIPGRARVASDQQTVGKVKVAESVSGRAARRFAGSTAPRGTAAHHRCGESDW